MRCVCTQCSLTADLPVVGHSYTGVTWPQLPGHTDRQRERESLGPSSFCGSPPWLATHTPLPTPTQPYPALHKSPSSHSTWPKYYGWGEVGAACSCLAEALVGMSWERGLSPNDVGRGAGASLCLGCTRALTRVGLLSQWAWFIPQSCIIHLALPSFREVWCIEFTTGSYSTLHIITYQEILPHLLHRLLTPHLASIKGSFTSTCCHGDQMYVATETLAKRSLFSDSWHFTWKMAKARLSS